MICPRCKAKNADRALFCAMCGVALSASGDDLTLAGDAGSALRQAAQPADSATAPPSSVTSQAGSTSRGAAWPTYQGVAHGLALGSDFGPRYRIEALLGEGGMGAVYKAYDKELDRVVALKLLRPEMTASEGSMRRFKQELLLASKISHKNILRIHDIGDAGGVKFISMAFVEGRDLHQIIEQEGRLSTDRTLGITRQVASALAAAHGEGVIHRDLKPQNVMLDANGAVFVTDFGLAKSLEADLSMTRSGEYVGTPRYMSPEQVEQKPVDARTDIYALGLLLYEMVTGDIPFKGETMVQMMFNRIQAEVRPPRELAPELPESLERVIMRCLERDPARRYQQAREILQDLDVRRSPSAVASQSWMGVLPVSPERRWMVWAGGAAVLLALFSLAIPQVRRGVFGGEAAAPAEQRASLTVLIADFENQTGDAVFDGTVEPALGIAVEDASFISTFSRSLAMGLAVKLQPEAKTLNENLAKLVAVREGINVVLGGAVARSGGGYQLTVRAWDGAAGSEISRFEVKADDKQEVLTAVGKLAARTRKALGDNTPESAQLAAAETYTAASLEAAQQYALGQSLMSAGKYPDAILAYQKAVGLDPELGRAYAGMAASYNNMGQAGEAEKHYKLALSKIDRMSDREKYRTRSAYYLVTRNPDKAIEELNELVRRYPADTAGQANLALAYFFRRDMKRALEHVRLAVKLSPKSVPQRNNMGLFAMYGGDFQTALSEQKAVVGMNASFVLAYVGTALSHLAEGRVAEAVQTYQKLAGVSDWGKSASVIGLADVALYEGRAADAVILLRDGAAADAQNKNADAAADKLAALAHACLLAGKPVEAASAADRALAASQKDSIRYWAARAYIEAGKESVARSLAIQLGKSLEADPQAYGKLIEAEILLKQRKTPEAVRVLRESQKLADSWLGRQTLGRAYLEAEAFAEASSEFDLCWKRRGEATAAFLDEVPTYRLFPQVYYYQGRVREGLGSPAAAESYRTFLAIRQNGVEDRQVKDAKQRLSGR